MSNLDVIDRINLLVEAEKLSREMLSRRTGINYSRWTNVLQRKAKARHEEIEALGKAWPEEIEALGKAWPEYRLWLAFGDVLPEAGQISPMSKVAPAALSPVGEH